MRHVGFSAVLWALMSTAQIVPSSAGAQDRALVIIVHRSNPVHRLGALELNAIFTSSQRFWPNGEPLVAFNSPPGSPSRIEFDRAVLRMDPDEAGRFWIDHRVSGKARPPRKVPTARVALAIVRRMKTAVAYVPEGVCSQDVRVVAVVRAGRVVPPSTVEASRCGD